ncbi:hypothetical protein [Microbispora sp. ATCC PTA-5024]|uniref:hypothetical protein n=1 Tax=Microbispora sp. ATCC PTA-5024 TaxID=316330 RepID=UPI0003DD60D3|nr:hypothetical protein [Microbispora sp. ATCC PTA-5024]ETK32290.1 hypothetical protein MPTA5024_30610 [Microbispora sp. ATCC PTA-5024]
MRRQAWTPARPRASTTTAPARLPATRSRWTPGRPRGWPRASRSARRRCSRSPPGLTPVLWPEHFDLAVTLDEVNYGISPGDGHLPEPYAYVGPWTPRTGPFWNAPFGASRPLRELGGAEAVRAFFEQGRTA